VFPFAAGCRAGGDHPNRLTTVRVDNDNNPAGRILPNRHESLLTAGTRILRRERKRVEENRLSVREANSMLALIRRRFPGIPHNPHEPIIYIQYAYIKGPVAIGVSRNRQQRGDLPDVMLVTGGSKLVQEEEQDWTGSFGIRGCSFFAFGATLAPSHLGNGVTRLRAGSTYIAGGVGIPSTLLMVGRLGTGAQSGSLD
jgi:hypothetical protein